MNGTLGDFALGGCKVCGREVLSYVDGQDVEVRRCVHCDTRLGGVLRWIDAGALESAGYGFDVEPAKGCSSCVRGGCGTGIGGSES